MSDPHTTPEVESAISLALSAGMEEADADQIMLRLNQELEAQADEKRLVLSADDTMESWVLSPENEPEMPTGLAYRFLNYYGAALRRELCDEQGGCLKESYRSMLLGGDLKSKLQTLAPIVLGAIGVSATLAAPAVIAALVAVWLLRVGLEQWCASSTIVPAAGEQPATN